MPKFIFYGIDANDRSCEMPFPKCMISSDLALEMFGQRFFSDKNSKFLSAVCGGRS